jgi:allantoin racemase
MKLLLVNGNTTQVVTDRVVAEATRCAAPGTAITGVTARFGVGIVSTEAEEVIAGHAVLDALAANFTGHDAAILAISFDTALLGARQIVPIPVIGMTEASLLTACLLGRRFGLISFGQSSRAMYLAGTCMGISLSSGFIVPVLNSLGLNRAHSRAVARLR